MIDIQKGRYYLHKKVEDQRQQIVESYVSKLKEIFPGGFIEVFDRPQVEELVCCQLELKHINIKIGNNGFMQEDGFEFMPGSLLNQRKILHASMDKYRRNLMMMLITRVKSDVNVEGKKGKEEKLRALLANDEFTE